MWKIDETAFEQAKTQLNISLPVRIRQADLLSGMAGKYHGLGVWGPTTDERLESPAHHISLGQGLGAQMANTALWHELTHAAQCEDFLPEDGNYQVANRKLRQAFGIEMREIRTRRGISRYAGITHDYGDVSFEEEAREWMKNADKIKILVPIDDEKSEKNEKGENLAAKFRDLWRVDMWSKKDVFVGTTYVWADDDFAAKRWARDNHMKDMDWSLNVYAYPIDPETRGGAK